jgi:hypothetical protein
VAKYWGSGKGATGGFSLIGHFLDKKEQRLDKNQSLGSEALGKRRDKNAVTDNNQKTSSHLSVEEKADQSWEQRSTGKEDPSPDKPASERSVDDHLSYKPVPTENHGVDQMKQSVHWLFTAYCCLPKMSLSRACSILPELHDNKSVQTVTTL